SDGVRRSDSRNSRAHRDRLAARALVHRVAACMALQRRRLRGFGLCEFRDIQISRRPYRSGRRLLSRGDQRACDAGDPRHDLRLPAARSRRSLKEVLMTLTRLSLYYLCGYLILGGVALLFFPALSLRLLLSNGAYGDVMPRLVGMLLAGLGL